MLHISDADRQHAASQTQMYTTQTDVSRMLAAVPQNEYKHWSRGLCSGFTALSAVYNKTRTQQQQQQCRCQHVWHDLANNCAHLDCFLL